MTWDGKERRQNEDHDLIIEIHTTIKQIATSFETHLQQDREDFEKVHKRINKLSWYAGLGAGAVFALEFFKEKIFR